MSKITRVEIFQVDLKPHVQRGDAIQSFHTQETPMVRVYADDGAEGTGYTYTIGTGGSSIVVLLRDHLGPQLLGRDPACAPLRGIRSCLVRGAFTGRGSERPEECAYG